MFTRPESDRVVYWKRHYHGLETSAFVFFVGRVTTLNRIDMSFEVRLSVNRLSISSVQNRAVTFKIWSEVLLQTSGGLCFTFIICYNFCVLLIKVILTDRNQTCLDLGKGREITCRLLYIVDVGKGTKPCANLSFLKANRGVRTCPILFTNHTYIKHEIGDRVAL